MKNIEEVLAFSKDYLEKAAVENPRYSAESIIAHALACNRLDIYLNYDRPLTTAELDKIRILLKRRRAKEPLQYLFEETEFFNCKLKITKDVLIPRPETEELVEFVYKTIYKDLFGEEKNGSKVFNKEVTAKKTLWDICTGSGCIAISLKKLFPSFEVNASDISIEALNIAKKNATINECGVDFRLGDLLLPFKNEKADYLICNPPYISEKEFSFLSDDVKNFEPKIALVAKEDGLEFYKRFADILPAFLTPKAKVFFEIGYGQGEMVKDIFVDRIWRSKKVYKDLSGKDRFFFLEIE